MFEKDSERAKAARQTLPTSDKPGLLGGFLSREQTAAELDVSVRTLDRWHSLGIGPPRISHMHLILYDKSSLLTWIRSRETNSVT